MTASMSGNIKENILLKDYTTFKIGGRAEYFIEAQSIEEIERALAWAQEAQLSITVLGGGSNVLIADEGISGLVVVQKNKGMSVVSEDDQTVHVEVAAGEEWDSFVAQCTSQGWWGVENLSSIPGSVGATPIQNVGAYGVEVADVIVAVTTLHMETGQTKVFSPAECAFAYRNSFFKSAAGRQYVVTKVTFLLQKNGSPQLQYKDLQIFFADKPTPSLLDIRRGVQEIRRKKFPDLQKVGTAGSFFKNPIIPVGQYEALQKVFPDMPGFQDGESVKVSAAWLIDKVAGLRGATRGEVGTYESQALVMVNYGGASAVAVKKFSQEIVMIVKEKTDITLEPEVTFYPQSF